MPFVSCLVIRHLFLYVHNNVISERKGFLVLGERKQLPLLLPLALTGTMNMEKSDLSCKHPIVGITFKSMPYMHNVFMGSKLSILIRGELGRALCEYT